MKILTANCYFVNFSALRANFSAAIKSVRLVRGIFTLCPDLERSTLRHGMRMCIVNVFVASHLLFGPVKHFLSPVATKVSEGRLN